MRKRTNEEEQPLFSPNDPRCLPQMPRTPQCETTAGSGWEEKEGVLVPGQRPLRVCTHSVPRSRQTRWPGVAKAGADAG